MPCWTRQPWPHNLNQTASGKPGAVQFEGSWADQTGVTYETGAVLTEEYWLNADGTIMIQHWILEDPKTYAHPLHHVQWFTRFAMKQDAVFDEYVCNIESARPELILQRYATAPAAASGTLPPTKK